jgi:hypothetical protein
MTQQWAAAGPRRGVDHLVTPRTAWRAGPGRAGPGGRSGLERGETGTQAMAGVAASAASRISSVAISGCDTIDAWEAATSRILAPARSAMNR